MRLLTWLLGLLEAPHRRWMRGEGMALVPWSPPAVGETVTVPAPL